MGEITTLQSLQDENPSTNDKVRPNVVGAILIICLLVSSDCSLFAAEMLWSLSTALALTKSG